jgi:hypothetical protein
MEVNMSELMDLLRGPALGVVFMIILLAGVLLITAFAALMAQMGLLFRMKSWNTSETFPKNQESETGVGPDKRDSMDITFLPRVSNPHQLQNALAHHRWWFMSQMRTKWWMLFGGRRAKQGDPGLLLHIQGQPAQFTSC